MRLDKYLSDAKVCSRKEVKIYCKAGKIKVNDVVMKKSDIKIDETKDVVFVNNIPVVYEKYVYYMLNKPAGVVSATTDKSDKTVVDLITDNKKEIFPVGRLDKDTVGLLLLTNDGDFAHRLLSPGKHVPKTYFVRVEGTLTEEHVRQFAQGIELQKDGRMQPAKLEILTSGDISEANLTIYEGKFHQIKRMMHVIQCQVIYLKRIAMGSLSLDEHLKEGEYRRLTKQEKDDLCLYMEAQRD